MALFWALNPWTLNEKQEMGRVILDVNKARRFTQSPFKILLEKQPDEDIDKVVAINTQQRDIRLLAQQSVFTMHGSINPLEEYEGRDMFLRRYIIPENSKHDFRKVLQQLGIKESNLFPDLDHLAKELNSQFSSPQH